MDSSQEISAYTRNHWTPTQNDVVYMPDQYVALEFCHRDALKMEKTWSMCINLMWCIKAQHNNKTTFALVKLIGSVASAPQTQACSPPLLLLLHDVAVSDYGGDVGWWHHRFTKYTDWLYTRKCKGVIFRFIHSETRFQKIAVSGSQNTRSIWYDTTFLHIQQNVSVCMGSKKLWESLYKYPPPHI